MESKEKVIKEGLRFNSGKRKWGLLSWPALEELVKVLEFGAQKYAAWNWTNGLSWSECYESLMRHLTKWYLGEDKDEETGLSHMAHVLCNAMFLLHFTLFKTGRDDRPTALRGETIEPERPIARYPIPPGSTWPERTYADKFGRTNSPAGTETPSYSVGPECRVPDVQADVQPKTR